jgi:hypothetical protein
MSRAAPIAIACLFLAACHSAPTPTATATEPSGAARVDVQPRAATEPPAVALLPDLMGRSWSPTLSADEQASCAAPDAPSDCLARLRAQATRERLRFEATESPDVVVLVSSDDSVEVARDRYRAAAMTSGVVLTSLRRPSDSLRVTLVSRSELRIETARGARSFVSAASAEAGDARTLQSSAWVELATGPLDRTGKHPYVGASSITAAEAPGVFPGGVSPEAAVTHYLASRIRSDERYREVLSPSCDGRCAYKLAKHDSWTFLAFRLISRAEAPNGDVNVKVWFKIRGGDKVAEGTSDFVARLGARGWRLVELPS